VRPSGPYENHQFGIMIFISFTPQLYLPLQLALPFEHV